MSSVATKVPLSVDTRLKFGRTILLLIYALAVGSVLASIPARYRELAAPYDGEQFDLSRLTTQYLAEIGLSPNDYAIFALLNELFWVGVPIIMAALIFWRRSDSLFAQYVGVVLVTLTATTVYLIDALNPIFEPAFYIENALQSFGIIGIVLLFQLFPNGRFVPRSMIVVGIAWVTLNIAWIFLPDLPGNLLHGDATWRIPWLLYAEGVLFFGTGIASQLYRYFRVADRIEKQQTKWIVIGFVVFYIGFSMRPYFFEHTSLTGVVRIAALWGISWLALALPISFGLALLRYRLWDIDIILSRALVYGSLGVLLLGVYLGVIFGTQTLLNSPSPISNFVATLLVAVLFQPLRDRLQRVASRYLFGDRDDPMRVLGKLGERLEGVVDSAEILPTIVDTLTTSLRIPYAAIALRDDGAYTVTTSQGTPSGDLLTLPLNYQGTQVGELRIAQRTAADPFDASDHKLLDTVAQQAGTAVHAVQLTHELRRSRQRLVTTREEERRRLRRDLHDGLGPTLAAQIFRVGAIRQLVHKNPDKADTLLADLEDGLDNTLNEIRRVVYALRPPALDQLGLIGATTDFIRKYESTFKVEFKHPHSVGPLSAAVEVAAFRIIQTALDNVSQHAQAQRCQIILTKTATDLTLHIEDDGVGMPNPSQAGVGLTSMRERAEELDGTFTLTTGKLAGVCLLISLPLGD